MATTPPEKDQALDVWPVAQGRLGRKVRGARAFIRRAAKVWIWPGAVGPLTVFLS